MTTPQFTDEDTGFGLGFMVGKFRRHRTFGHSGAVYGYSTSLTILPKAKVAAIILVNEDIISGRVACLRTEALSLLLKAKLGEEPPAPSPSYEAHELTGFTGDYESESYWAELEVRDGRLLADISGQPTTFTPTAENQFLANSRIVYDGPVTFELHAETRAVLGFDLGGQVFRRVLNSSRLPPSWRRHLGAYGHDFIPLIVTERYGRLYVMTENMVDYRLTPVNQHTFALPPGMYASEHLVFLGADAGPTPRIDFCNMFFHRRP